MSKTCTLLKNGYCLTYPDFDQSGVCCYNRNSSYSTYEVHSQHCGRCIAEEDAGMQSYREGINLKYPISKFENKGIVLLDLTPNIGCNLACKICSEGSSTTWAKLKNIKIEKANQITYDDFFKKMSLLDLTNLKEINFSGGEPLLNKNIVKYLSCLEQQVDFGQIELRFSTNGTHILTDDVSEFFSKFKLVSARFSLDDVGHGHEYHRYPAKWDEFVVNWEYFLANMPVQVLPSINRTIGLLNLNRLDLLDRWAQDYKTTRLGDTIELINHFVFGPTSIDNVTREIKDYIKTAHGKDSQAWNFIKNKIPKNDISTTLDYINSVDQLHHQPFKDYDPIMYQVLFTRP